MTSATLSPFAASLYVALGGGVGALMRFQVGRAAAHFIGTAGGFPWATLAVNVIGSLLMGVLLGWLARSSHTPQSAETIRLLLGVGLLGGFTTFSAFSAEMITLIHRGQMLQGLAYGSVSVLAGMAAFLAGLVVMQTVMMQSAP
ncbi:fluoride efflux transporter CrcB [Qipengyuania sp. ASV99]|uniref:fluoride efflux transporter CrcB n=1 Tax=Qipengyuania sp. ASV99 TaxID=3399681 RepID=UPI003A4C786B